MNELLNELTQLLKDDILNNHYGTGALYESIEFRFEDKIRLYSEEYINYLEDGEYLQSFFDRSDVEELISEIYKIHIEEILKEKLEK